ncbi:ABC transporter permease [Clostridium cellulovorans]|uniref:ABC transporter permease n=1 Tax=Clostridium cellulovorans (strain ATCC 35296 / DSM 3052 / OCM 3 / 743B) TaxID=573061 RepID=D9SS61_CLOC7|nr:ABC transporter permease [Clostridium cellulovorans]ADL52508.1 hypothetical protein Clocel_2811 [Clostridium cellulovorans 743B]
MIKLLKLELKKINFYHVIFETFLINIMLLILFFIFQYISSKNYIVFMKNSVVDVLISFPFLMYTAVLISRIIIEEYKNRTIYLIFMYPVNKTKVMLVKLLLIIIISVLSIVVAKFSLYWSFRFLELKCSNFCKIPSKIFEYKNNWKVNVYIISSCITALTPSYFAVKRKEVNQIVLREFILVAILCIVYFKLGFNMLLLLLVFLGIVAVVAIIMTLKEIHNQNFEADVYYINTSMDIGSDDI